MVVQRLINKRCCASAVIRQFARLTVQFSLEGFTRLQNIAEQPHLAVHVKKLSYMVPRFYLQGKIPLKISRNLLTFCKR
jgi:hypothetical protein